MDGNNTPDTTALSAGTRAWLNYGAGLLAAFDRNFGHEVGLDLPEYGDVLKPGSGGDDD